MKALALLLEENSTLSSMTDMADSAVFWKINTDIAAIMLRDKLIVEVRQATFIYQFQYINLKLFLSSIPLSFAPDRS